MVDQTQFEELAAASRRLVRTVDGMADSAYAEPSLLPDWTRGDVVAHLALNAEGLGGALRGLAEGRSVPMYASTEARAADVLALGAADPDAIRSRLLGAVTDFSHALRSVPEEAWDAEIDRTPGVPAFAAVEVPWMRNREVEIHHADLGLAYTYADWPASFALRLMESMVERDVTEPFTVCATDLDRTWHLGPQTHDGPTVSGAAAELGWWLTGRGDGAGLSVADGKLPRIGAW